MMKLIPIALFWCIGQLIVADSRKFQFICSYDELHLYSALYIVPDTDTINRYCCWKADRNCCTLEG